MMISIGKKINSSKCLAREMTAASITILGLLSSIVAANISNNHKNSPATSELDKFNANVLGRHTRAVVFPKSAQLVLTPSFSKAVLDGRPRGLLYTVEFDMAFPLPDTIEGWSPKLLVNEFKPQNTSWQPPKLSNRNLNGFSAYTKSLGHRIHGESPLTYVGNYDYYNFPFQETDIENGFKWNRAHAPTIFPNRLFEGPSYKKSNKLRDFASQFHKLPYRQKYKRINMYASDSNQNLEGDTDDTELHHEYYDRERRDIFKQLRLMGKMFKFDMNKCIRRTICELNARFGSYGESLMEDLVRLILIPAGHKSSANYINVNCEQHFAASCPYSILKLFNQKLQ